MRHLFLLTFVFLLCVNPLSAQTQDKLPVDYVNPQIDTVNCRWFYFSSACRPFGMVNLSPDTVCNLDWGGGYIYDKDKIRCFSHIHCWQLSGIPVLPTAGAFKGHLGMDVYQSAFSHDDEVVRPGYHKVILRDYKIQAELTSTTRIGFHRYTYPAGSDNYILFDTGAYLGMCAMQSSYVRQVSDTEIEGWSLLDKTGRRAKPVQVYFVARFSQPMTSFGGWVDKKLSTAPVTEIQGKDAGAFVQFTTAANQPVLMKVAIAYTSIDQARKNLTTELPHWNFDQVVEESRAEWNRWLARIEVRGGTEKQRVKFYTDLWHALLGRRIVSDVDGRYIDNTGAQPVIRQTRLDEKGNPLYPHYNFDALWGAHWSINILWSMVYPEVMDGFCNTMVDMYQNGGLIPRGPSGGNYTYVMIGDPATSFFACAYNKGIRHWDSALAYAGLRKNAFPGGIRDRAGYEATANPAGGGMKYYVERGYVPLHNDGTGGHREGAAQTLEYAWQDWCLAQLAKALGKEDDYQLFMVRSQNYTNMFDPKAGQKLDAKLGFDASSGWMRPREKNGSWYDKFNPVGEGFNCKGFVESNSAIYTWFVPHDLAGLAALMGGAQKAAAKLNREFELAVENRYIAPHGKHSLYWVDYENQPATGMAHIFNYLHAPHLSQYWVHRVKEEAFSDITPYGGYNGDEDQGQMGALGVLMAMGLFEMDGGCRVKPIYEITSPLFDRVIIHLNNDYYPGGSFEITTQNNSPDNIYIQSAQFNGQPLNRCWFEHSAFAAGGKLQITLGPQPNFAWAADPQAAPQFK